MLHELRVENLLLIERAELRLAPGLNVLTGETGAGKTVLAHALDLLLGGRARPGIVRPGAGEAYVEGAFDLDAALRAQLGERIAPDAEELVLARRVGSDGRTRAYVGGRSATVAELRDVGTRVLAFYGQHEHRKLTVSSAQLAILDSLCPPAQAGRLERCASLHARVRELRGRAEELRELEGERERELDLLEFELAEVDALGPSEQEHEQLLAARERLRRSEALASAAAAGALALSPDSQDRAAEAAPGASGQVVPALAAMQALAGIDPALDALADRMSSVAIELDDLGAELRSYAEGAALGELAGGDGAGGPAQALERTEERLAAIERLARKHGGTVAGVLQFAERARERHVQLAGVEGALQDTVAELEAAERDHAGLAAELHAARAKAAKRFATLVAARLDDLAMPDASFDVALSDRELGPDGADAVDFLIAPNPGVPAGPVREIASGGELSRVMLAIMSVAHQEPSRGASALASSAAGATLVFDEVDAGVGGHTARSVGAQLRELASARQVLCITHLPQIASLGERHFVIVKDTGADPTRATVEELGEGEVESELVRMLGADSDDSGARRHARELLRAA